MKLEKWRQGKLLITNNTEKWNQLLKEDVDSKEKKQVFVYFHNSDSGKSRKRICICDTAENARLIASTPEILEALIETTKEIINNNVNSWSFSSTIKTPEEILIEVIKENEYIPIIEKATGKTWRELSHE